MTQLLSSQTDALVANARLYRDRLFRPGAPRKPRTGVVVVTCMDARINVYALLGLDEGDAHVVRNAGGIVTEDVIRSLTISQRLLNTAEVMIIMHGACGLRETTDERFMAELQADVGLRPTWRVEAFYDAVSEYGTASRGCALARSCATPRASAALSLTSPPERSPRSTYPRAEPGHDRDGFCPCFPRQIPSRSWCFGLVPASPPPTARSDTGSTHAPVHWANVAFDQLDEVKVAFDQLHLTGRSVWWMSGTPSSTLHPTRPRRALSVIDQGPVVKFRPICRVKVLERAMGLRLVRDG